MNKRSTFIVKDGKGNVRLYYLVDLKNWEDIMNSETSDYSFEDGIDVNVFDLYEQNQVLQHQLEEKDKVIDEAIDYIENRKFKDKTYPLKDILEILERNLK